MSASLRCKGKGKGRPIISIASCNGKDEDGISSVGTDGVQMCEHTAAASSSGRCESVEGLLPKNTL